jgi:hypothetical protein
MSTATTMQSFVDEFLAERRRLGFASRSMGYALRSFAAYVDALQITGPLRLEVMGAHRVGSFLFPCGRARLRQVPVTVHLSVQK